MYLNVIILVLILIIISVIIKKLLEKIKINKIDHYNLQKIYISMSTIPPRIKNLEPVIESLLNQSIQPERIYINIPRNYKRFNDEIEIPEFLKKEKLVKIFYTDMIMVQQPNL